MAERAGALTAGAVGPPQIRLPVKVKNEGRINRINKLTIRRITNYLKTVAKVAIKSESVH